MLQFISSCTDHHTLTLSFKTSNQLNLDANHQSKPVQIRLYELTSPLPFKHSAYSQLTLNAEQTLKDTLLDYDDYELQPAEHKTIKLTVDPTVKYLGITVGYHQLSSKWKCIQQIPQTHKQITLVYKINLDSLNCMIREYYL